MSGLDVLDDEKGSQVVERHRTTEAAVQAALRLNGFCLHCSRPLAECRIDNPRDEDFGADYDDSED